ncbi:FecR family protein [Desertivirga xinjiangensis]|uniref:FecR family protein n=1 Tax=Desertivirga xinjiangensis TaxID=539206 RepID=UPI00210B94A4|nr:FecR domain-containing protein [Pedobacter xinjiangensis]
MEFNEQGFQKAELILKFMRNELSKAEEQELFSWLEEDQENKEFFDKLMKEPGLQEELAFFQSTRRDEAWDEITKELEPVGYWAEQDRSNHSSNYRSLLRYAAAASVLLILSFGAFFLLKKEKQQEVIAVKKQEIKPGGNRAMLTLADGRQISLDDAANGELAKLENISIVKTAGGQIVYQIKDNNSNNTDPSGPIAYNTISTPRGGQYKVILPDGSSVLLNAVSSLKYPTSFSASKQRKVELTGEAYFEVAKDKARPFIVSCNNQTVQVLGTHFNINGYSEEGVTKTTLLEGAVRVKSSGGSVDIRPGEQSLLASNETLSVSAVDTEEAVAWVNGNFMFNSQDLGSIMRSVSRWYDTDVQYIDNIASRKFTGSISRYENVTEVLNMLELTGLVHFKVDGRRILVMK